MVFALVYESVYELIQQNKNKHKENAYIHVRKKQ